MLAGQWRTWCAYGQTWWTDCWWQCSRGVPFLGREVICHFQRLSPHKTRRKKKVLAGVHSEDPRVTERCVVLDNPQPHNPQAVKFGVGYGEA